MPTAILESQLESRQNAIAIDREDDGDSSWGPTDPVRALVPGYDSNQLLAWNDPLCRALRALLSGQTAGPSFTIHVDWDDDLLSDSKCHGRDFGYAVDPLAVTFTPIGDGAYLVTGYRFIEPRYTTAPLAYQEVMLTWDEPVTYYFDGSNIYAFAYRESWDEYHFEQALFVGNKNEMMPYNRSDPGYAYTAFAGDSGFAECAEEAAALLSVKQQQVVEAFYAAAQASWRHFVLKRDLALAPQTDG